MDAVREVPGVSDVSFVIMPIERRVDATRVLAEGRTPPADNPTRQRQTVAPNTSAPPVFLCWLGLRSAMPTCGA